MKKIAFIFLSILLLSVKLFAQEKPIQGIVFDRDSKQRLSRVYIYNLNTGKGLYNNTKGEFSTTAKPGDILVAALQGYGVDTVSIDKANTVLFYLRRSSIQLKEVIVRDSTLSPKDKLKATKEEYSGAYSKGNVRDIFTTGGASGAGGAGLSVSSLYNLLSKEGRNARQLQKIIERDYHDAMISYRYTPRLVNNVTGLNGDKLVDFMQQYRPSYNFVLIANDYEMIRFIQSSLQTYLKNPSALRLPPLKTSAQ